MNPMSRPLANGISTTKTLRVVAKGVLFSVLALLLPACLSLRSRIAMLSGEPPITQAPPQKQLNQPVQHVFVIFKENHTYDNYFLAYPNPTALTPSPTTGLAKGGTRRPPRRAHQRRLVARRQHLGRGPCRLRRGLMDGFDQAAHQPSTGRPVFPCRRDRRRLRELRADRGRSGGTPALLLVPRRPGRPLRQLLHLPDGPELPEPPVPARGDVGRVHLEPGPRTANSTILDPDAASRSQTSTWAPAQIPTALPVQLEAPGSPGRSSRKPTTSRSSTFRPTRSWIFRRASRTST